MTAQTVITASNAFSRNWSHFEREIQKNNFQILFVHLKESSNSDSENQWGNIIVLLKLTLSLQVQRTPVPLLSGVLGFLIRPIGSPI